MHNHLNKYDKMLIVAKDYIFFIDTSLLPLREKDKNLKLSKFPNQEHIVLITKGILSLEREFVTNHFQSINTIYHTFVLRR